MESELLLLENPMGYGNPWYGQPIRHSRAAKKGKRRKKRKLSKSRRRNPIMRKNTLAMGTTWREWTQGASAMDIGAAVGGLAASSMIPGMLVKDTTTNTKKALKLAASFGIAVAAGSVGKAVLGDNAGKAAVLGGMTGFGVQLLSALTGVQIGGQLTSGRGVRRIGPGSAGNLRRYPASATESPFGTARLQ